MKLQFLPQWLHIFLSHKFKYFEDNMFQNFQLIVSQGELIRLRKIMNEIIFFESCNISAINNLIGNPSLFHSIKIFRSCNLISTLVFNERIVRSFTLSSVNQKRFNYPLPPSYWQFFENNGIQINKIMSCFWWLSNEIFNSCKQVFITLIKCFGSNQPQEIPPGSMLIFGLNEKVLTKTSEDEKCFEAWLRDNFKFGGNMYGLNLNNIDLRRSKIINASFIDLFDYRSGNLIKVFVQMIRFQLSIYEVGLTLRYFHEVYKCQFWNVKNSRNITTFITIASETWVKPAWFSQVKLNDPRIIFINLSSSSSPKTSHEIEAVGWERLNLWDEVWVLDDYQKQLFSTRLINSKSKVTTMGCPFWTDNLKSFAELKDMGDYIAIFDFQPSRKFLGWSSLYDCGYFDSASILNYIRDILVVSASLGKTCVLKSKRTAPRYLDSEYYQGIENLRQEFDNFIYADAEIAPHRIIKDALVTISIPFTSTAIIASELGIPSLYYDPIGRVLPNDPSARTTRVVSGQTELCAELYKLIPEKFL
jgi:hypothetical protein